LCLFFIKIDYEKLTKRIEERIISNSLKKEKENYK